MSKRNVNISIEDFIHDRAKKRFAGEISSICELALKVKLGETIDASEDDKECKHCASKENLIWECPGEFWVCDRCIKEKVRSVLIRIAG